MLTYVNIYVFFGSFFCLDSVFGCVLFSSSLSVCHSASLRNVHISRSWVFAVSQPEGCGFYPQPWGLSVWSLCLCGFSPGDAATFHSLCRLGSSVGPRSDWLFVFQCGSAINCQPVNGVTLILLRDTWDRVQHALWRMSFLKISHDYTPSLALESLPHKSTAYKQPSFDPGCN